MLLALADGVHPGLAQHQRTLAGRGHQMGQVAAEVGLAMEVNIETDEVEKAQIQIFRRWIIRVGEERIRREAFADIIQVIEKPADRARAVPADDVGTDLVAEAEGEYH